MLKINKKYLKVVFFITIFIVFSINIIYRKAYLKKEISLPIINLLDISDDSFSTSLLFKNNKSLIIVYFHPDCDWCEMEINRLIDNHSLFSQTNFLFISYANKLNIKDFLEKVPIYDIPNSIIALDYNSEFREIYKPQSPPMIYIYDKDKCLLKVIKGLTSIKYILTFLDE